MYIISQDEQQVINSERVIGFYFWEGLCYGTNAWNIYAYTGGGLDDTGRQPAVLLYSNPDRTKTQKVFSGLLQALEKERQNLYPLSACPAAMRLNWTSGMKNIK